MAVIIEEIEFRGVTLDVELDYTPSEPMVMYYSDMSGYPGSPAEIGIINIQIGDQDAMELLEDYLDEITDLLYEKLES
jgi:hypothetical protein